MRARAALSLFALVSLAGCKKVIGDGCGTSADCSITGDRLCDVSQPEGYCTAAQCDPGGCPDEALCVAFNAHSQRLVRRFCMAACETDGDCRTPQYHCTRPTPACPGPGGRVVACEERFRERGPLPAGESCNVITDPAPAQPGWCAAGPPVAPRACPPP